MSAPAAVARKEASAAQNNVLITIPRSSSRRGSARLGPERLRTLFEDHARGARAGKRGAVDPTPRSRPVAGEEEPWDLRAMVQAARAHLIGSQVPAVQRAFAVSGVAHHGRRGSRLDVAERFAKPREHAFGAIEKCCEESRFVPLPIAITVGHERGQNQEMLARRRDRVALGCRRTGQDRDSADVFKKWAREVYTGS